MRIRLDRKKLLSVTFFFCCILPSYLKWFSLDGESFSGVSRMGPLFLLGVAVFAFALLFNRIGHVLAIGVSGHMLMLLALLLTCLRFLGEVRGGTAGELRLEFHISLVLMLVHLGLFATTEIAVQRLVRRKEAA